VEEIKEAQGEEQLPIGKALDYGYERRSKKD
jgi:hypothetical protein